MSGFYGIENPQDTTRPALQSEKGLVPSPTIQKIQNDVDAVMFPGFCTMRDAEILLMDKNPQLTITQMGKARDEIAKAVGDPRTTDFALNSLPKSIVFSSLFVQDPSALVEIASSAKEHTGWAFAALSNNLINRWFFQNPHEVADYFKYIVKSTGDNAGEVFFVLANSPDIATLFVQDPKKVADYFKAIAKAAGKGALEAFGALLDGKTASLFVQDPSRFVQLAQDNGEKTASAFLQVKITTAIRILTPTSETNLSPALEKKIKNDVDAFMGPGFCTTEIAQAIVNTKNPQETIEQMNEARNKIAKAARESANSALSMLSKPIVGLLFVQNPSAFADIAKATGRDIAVQNQAPSAFEALSDPDVALLFSQHPSAFVEIAKATGSSTVLAFRALSDKNTGKLFAANPSVFVDIAKGTKKDAGDVFSNFSDEHINRLFVEKPQQIVDNFIKIYKAAGDVNLGFRGIAPARGSWTFAQNPSAYADIADFAEKHTNSAFEALTNGHIQTWFLQKPDEVVDSFKYLVKSTGDNAGEVFRVLANSPDIALLFVQKPRQVTDYFKAISKATGKEIPPESVSPDETREVPLYGGYSPSLAYTALSYPNVSKLFVQNPSAFVDIAKAAGHGTGRAFDALGDPKIADLFAEDPARFVKLAQEAGEGAGDAFRSLVK